MPFISREDLIQSYPNIMPETVNLIRWFYDTFNNRSAANRQIVNVEPIFLHGALAGNEILTYAATKLYLCLECYFFRGSGTTSYYSVTLYNQADAVYGTLNNGNSYWDATAASVKYSPLTLNYKNLYFSRVASTNYDQFILNGYRITLV